MDYDLDSLFSYHAPDDGKKERCAYVRTQCLLLISRLIACCPESRELSLTITKIEEAMFWANAAIERQAAEE